MGVQQQRALPMETDNSSFFQGIAEMGNFKIVTVMNKEQLIRVLYPTVPSRPLCDYLGITMSQLYNRVFQMGVKKNPRIKYLQNRALRLNGGMKSRWQRGYEPHNKGKQMSSELYAEGKTYHVQALSNKPFNTREPNATSIRWDKTGRPYSYTKVKDSLWVLTHRLVWESIYGPIPKDHVVRFKDGNNLNIQIDNLECIPKTENAIRNSIHRFLGEVQTVIRLKSKLNKQIKQKQNGKKRNE
jgi:hypothetical protein